MVGEVLLLSIIVQITQSMLRAELCTYLPNSYVEVLTRSTSEGDYLEIKSLQVLLVVMRLIGWVPIPYT